MDALLQDTRYALRTLRRTPGFTAVAVLTLALGLGANTAVFSVVDAVLLRRLPYPEPERIVLLSERAATNPAEEGSTSFLNYLDWRAQASSFETIGIYQDWHPSLTGSGPPDRIAAAIVTSGVLEVLRARPLLGRAMLAADNEPGGPNVVLVSHGFWQRRLAGDSAAVGHTITLNSTPFEVIGVLPAAFRAPAELDAELWANNALDPRDTRGSRYLRVLARLEPGVTLAEARAEMAAISGRLASAYPATNAGMEAVVTPLRDTLVGAVERPLLLLLGAAGLVLLVACGNLSNLLIVRGFARGREVALRTALGASRSRTVRQLLVEAALLAGIGAVVGWLVAVWATPALLALGPEAVRGQPIHLDARLVAFSLGAVALTIGLTGLVPALRAGRSDLQSLLREGLGSSRAGARLRSAVTVGQLALALALLSGAGLLLRSFARLQGVESGIRPERVLAMSINLPGAKYAEQQRPQFFEALLANVTAIPGVEAAAVTSVLPFGGSWDRVALDIEGQPALQGTDRPEADRYIVSAGYQTAMGLRLVAGRFLSDDDRFDGALVCLVDEAFARRIAPEGSPLGVRLLLPGRDSFATVVGVVGHVKHYGLDAPSGGQVYMSHRQYPWRWMNLVTRTAGDPLAAVPTVRAAVRALDADQPVYDITTMERLMGERTAARRFLMTLLGLFAAVAVVLAGLGLYGVVAYAVSQRIREIGVRMALGAEAGRIVRMVVAEGATLVAAGLVIGIGCALGFARVMSGLLFQVRVTDPLTYALVVSLLAVLALLACWLPARRAARTDPMAALRNE